MKAKKTATAPAPSPAQQQGKGVKKAAHKQMGMDEEVLHRLLAEVVEEPHVFLQITDHHKKENLHSLILSTLKTLHDGPLPPSTPKLALGPLRELLVEGFDHEQIWEELQLRNKPLLQSSLSLLKNPENFIEEEEERAPKGEQSKKKDRKKKTPPADEEMELEDTQEEEIGNENFDDEEINEEDLEDLGDRDDLGDMKDFEEEDIEEDDWDAKKKGPKEKKKLRAGEDQFFNIDEMEQFIKEAEEAEEAEEEDEESEEEIDFTAEIPSDDEDLDDFDLGDDEEGGNKKKQKKKKVKPQVEDMTYKDFFKPPRELDGEEGEEEEMEGEEEEEEEEEEGFGEEGEMEVEEGDEDNFGEEDFDEEDFDGDGEQSFEAKIKKDLFSAEKEMGGSDDEEGLSKFEKKQKKISEIVKQLEEENLEEKHWTLKGEVDAKKRPLNSLLEEDLEFEHAAKVVPTVTEETTQTLEELIKKRILDGLYDDVERKYEQDFEYKPKAQIELDQEKSKKSLGEIYEDEYMKAKTGSDGLDEKVQKAHKNITLMFKELCGKLDALSNYHFIPKMPKEDVEIITNVPAITMEEVLPVNVSDATRLAPEEVYDKKKGDLPKGESEITSEERKRARAAKKKEKRHAKKEKEVNQKMLAKANPGLGNKHSKENTLKTLESSRNVIKAKETDTNTKYTSSSSVFAKLQQEATTAPAKKQPLKKVVEDNKPSSASGLRL